MTRYPGAVDGYQDIRIVRDSIEEVLARDHNDNRGAIIAIEQALGTNPQGIYGNVRTRLDQADTDFGEHIAGTGHRHVANHIDYPGSSPRTFADGYAMVPSRLGSTLDEIVARLGASTGATGADKIGAATFADSESKYSYTTDNVGDRIREFGANFAENAVLLERALGAFVADGMVVTQPWPGGGPSWDIYARVAAGHIVSDGRLLRHAGADVVVPASSGTYYVCARITSGAVEIVVDGTGLPSMDPAHPTVLLHKVAWGGSGAWSESVDIRRFGMLLNLKEAVSVGNAPVGGQDGYGFDFPTLQGAVEHVKALRVSTKLPMAPKIVLATDLSISNANEMDILLDVAGLEVDGCGRRITVEEGTSAFGALFRVEADRTHVHDLALMLDDTTSLLAFARIGASATANLSGIRIVRCGMETRPGKTPGAYFLRLGRNGNPDMFFSISDSIFADNTADVLFGGIVYEVASIFGVPLNTDRYYYERILRNSVVSGNRMWQSLVMQTAYAGIQVSDQCVVSGNTVSGGFVFGIALNSPADTVVSDNLIVGHDGSSIHMTLGVALACRGGPESSGGVLVVGNSVRGVGRSGADAAPGGPATYAEGCGVNAKIGLGGFMMSSTIIANNVVDNTDLSIPANLVVAVDAGDGSGVVVSGNKFALMGQGVKNGMCVVGNMIIGTGFGAVDPTDVVACASGASDALVCGNLIEGFNTNPLANSAINAGGSANAMIADNVVRNCSFHGIDATGVVGGIVSGNLLVVDNPAVNVGDGIRGFSDNCVVSGNIVRGYAMSPYYGIASAFGGSGTIVSGNLVVNLNDGAAGAIALTGFWRDVAVSGNVVRDAASSAPKTGITFRTPMGSDYALRAVVSGNLLVGNTNSGHGIHGVGPWSAVVGNTVVGYGNGVGGAIGIHVDGYSSAVCGNTVLAGSTLGAGVSLDTTAFGFDDYNVIADNILDSLPYVGIELGLTPASRQHIVAANIVRGLGLAASSPGISNVGLRTLVVGNNVTNANGHGISVAGIAAGGGDGAVVCGNLVHEANEHGVSVAGVDTGCLVTGNVVARGDANYGGIVLVDSSRVGICSNSVRGFLAGIWASVLAGSSEDALICGNSVFGADAGIVLGDGYAMVSSNLVMQSASAGIDGSFQDSLCIVGNLVKSSSSANGIEVNGCAKTLVVGNIAQVAGGGTSFLLTDPQPPNGLVMSGNLGVGGVVPLDGAGSPWPTGWHIAADCRWMPHP